MQTDGQTEEGTERGRHTESNSRFSQFFELINVVISSLVITGT